MVASSTGSAACGQMGIEVGIEVGIEAGVAVGIEVGIGVGIGSIGGVQVATAPWGGLSSPTTQVGVLGRPYSRAHILPVPRQRRGQAAQRLGLTFSQAELAFLEPPVLQHAARAQGACHGHVAALPLGMMGSGAMLGTWERDTIQGGPRLLQLILVFTSLKFWVVVSLGPANTYRKPIW